MKKILWWVLIISIIATIPSIYQRSKTEISNNTYEVILPYDEIYTLIDEDIDLDVNGVLEQLKDNGVTTISLEPETLETLEQKRVVSIIEHEDLKEKLLLNDLDGKTVIPDKKGLYVYISPESAFGPNIVQAFKDDIETVSINNKNFLFIPGDKSDIVEKPLGYDEDALKEIAKVGLHWLPRIPNAIDENNEYILNQIFDDPTVNSILYSGDEVLGYPSKNDIAYWMQEFNDRNYSIYSIEFADQKGFQSAAYYSQDYNILRLHSLKMDEESFDDSVDRLVRAVKERNIRGLFLRMGKDGSSEKKLKDTELLLQSVSEKMPNMFEEGVAKPFTPYSIPLWQKFFALLAGIALMGLAALTVFKNKIITNLALVGMGLIGILYLATGSSLFVKVFALIVAVVTPVYAVLCRNKIKGFGQIILTYLLAAAISFMGIWVIVSLLNGVQFLAKIDMFRGVKLVYVFPILFMAAYALWGYIFKYLKLPIRYWHLAVLFVIAGAVYYYIARSGNSGTASDLELQIRAFLEEALYVRPRTKEFLLGFPAFLLALYLYTVNKRVAVFMLIPGVIGFLSLVNTFTHLHIPLYLSFLRSIYSLTFGLIIGLIAIYIFKWAYRLYNQYKPRWHK